MSSVQILRIVVASPGDVQPERDALPVVIDELNKGIADEKGLRLELSRWETDSHPGFHTDGSSPLPYDQPETAVVYYQAHISLFSTPIVTATRLMWYARAIDQERCGEAAMAHAAADELESHACCGNMVRLCKAVSWGSSDRGRCSGE